MVRLLLFLHGRRSTVRLHARATLLAAGLAVGFGAAAAPADDDGWSFDGDLRAGWFASERTARDGAGTDDDAFNARLRLAVAHGLGERWQARTRLAGRFSSAQDGSAVYLRAYAPTRTGAAFGDVTLDEAYLGYQAPDDGLRLKLGRFQTSFTLPGVAAKGLDRNDSPNTDINWTDGVHLDMPVAGGWRGHVIGQYRHRKGSGGVAHAPLDFSDRDSRTTVFLGLENRQRLGPVIQRMVSMTWMPDSLADHGLADPSRRDYTTIDARIAAEWPLREGGPRLVAGVEAGYALAAPLDAVSGTGGYGDTGNLAWQVQASIRDIAPRHHVGVVAGQVAAGWLLSPDHRPNDRLAEIAYQWQFRPETSLEARFRERRELEHPAGTRARVDRDVYLRMTHRF